MVLVFFFVTRDNFEKPKDAGINAVRNKEKSNEAK